MGEMAGKHEPAIVIKIEDDDEPQPSMLARVQQLRSAMLELRTDTAEQLRSAKAELKSETAELRSSVEAIVELLEDLLLARRGKRSRRG